MAATIRLSQQHSCSLDYLVGAGEQHWRHFETKRFGGLEIDCKLVLDGCPRLSWAAQTQHRAARSARRDDGRRDVGRDRAKKAAKMNVERSPTQNCWLRKRHARVPFGRQAVTFSSVNYAGNLLVRGGAWHSAYAMFGAIRLRTAPSMGSCTTIP